MERAAADVADPPTQAGSHAAPKAGVRGPFVSAALSTLISLISLQIWRVDLQVPLYPNGDTTSLLAAARNIQLTGWFQETPLLNYPFGQNLRGFPGAAADTLHLVILKILLIPLNAPEALNVYFLMSFPVVAISCHYALRRLVIDDKTCIFIATLFSLAPYHFAQSERHLFLSAYFMVPWGCVAALTLYQNGWRPPLPQKRQSALSQAVPLSILACTGVYYAAFTIALIIAAALLRFRRSCWRELVQPCMAVSLMMGIMALEALPNLLYRSAAAGSQLTGRNYAATEYYSLKIDHLLLPMPLHRVGALGQFARRTFEGPIPGEGGDHLGLVAAFGTVVAVVAVLRRHHSQTRSGFLACGTLILVATLLGTVAGLSGLFSALGISYIRTWSRIAIFIAFFGLLAATLFWQRFVRQVPGVSPARASLYRGTLIVTIYTLAVLDQTAPAYAPPYGAARADWYADEHYFSRVQEAIGTQAAVFQLPYVEFPEGLPPGPVDSYDNLRGYLHSSIQWSAGGVRGESTTWQPEALRAGLKAALPRIQAVGFDAVCIDRLAYADFGHSVESVLRLASMKAPLVGNHDRWATYILDPAILRASATDRDEARRLILDPVQLEMGPEFEPGQAASDTLVSTASTTSTVTLIKPTASARRVRLQGAVTLDRPGSIKLRGPEGAMAIERLSSTSFLIDDSLSLLGGRTSLRIELAVTGGRKTPAPIAVRATLTNFHVEDEELRALLR